MGFTVAWPAREAVNVPGHLFHVARLSPRGDISEGGCMDAIRRRSVCSLGVAACVAAVLVAASAASAAPRAADAPKTTLTIGLLQQPGTPDYFGVDKFSRLV